MWNPILERWLGSEGYPLTNEWRGGAEMVLSRAAEGFKRDVSGTVAVGASELRFPDWYLELGRFYLGTCLVFVKKMQSRFCVEPDIFAGCGTRFSNQRKRVPHPTENIRFHMIAYDVYFTNNQYYAPQAFLFCFMHRKHNLYGNQYTTVKIYSAFIILIQT